MAKQYAPKTFLRQVRGALVEMCLRRRGVELALHREIIKPACVDENFAKLMSLPPETLRILEGDFAAITGLASPQGTAALLREGERQDVDFSQVFATARNDYERACWVFLKHPEIFELAACFFEMDRFSNGRWNRRFVGEQLKTDTSADGIGRLGQLMRESYAKEGRCRHCHIDHYVRQNPERHCYFAYPEDHASTDLAYTDGGELQNRTRKSAFEVIFVYRPESGLLEVLAPGGKERVEDLASCFCVSILGLPDLPPQIVPEMFDLSVLKSPDIRLPTNPADGIEDVILREVRLHLPRRQNWQRKITFAGEARQSSFACVHELICQTVDPDHIPVSSVVVAGAKLTVVFAARDRGRPKRVSFEIGVPNHCSLKDDPHDQVIRGYLDVWGLTTQPIIKSAVARVGPSRPGTVQLRRYSEVAAEIA